MLAFLLCLLAQDGEIPAHDGWVTDRAGFLTEADERELEALAESYQTGSGHEIAILTVLSLGGRPIEQFAPEAARSWGIGREGENDGALLVAAREERALRIEVGRGLEGTLTDSISGRIIRDVIVPEFRAGRYRDGLRAGLLAMHAAAGGDYGPIERTPAGRDAVASAAGLLVSFLAIGFFLWLLSRGHRSIGRGDSFPWLLWLFLSRSGRGGRGTYDGGFHGSLGGGFGGGGHSGGGFSGFGGGGGFSGGGASGRW